MRTLATPRVIMGLCLVGIGLGQTVGAVSAGGGDVIQEIGGHRIHTFTNTGTSAFVVTAPGEVEYLVVGGGWGGGCAYAGGGGAGRVQDRHGGRRRTVLRRYGGFWRHGRFRHRQPRWV